MSTIVETVIFAFFKTTLLQHNGRVIIMENQAWLPVCIHKRGGRGGVDMMNGEQTIVLVFLTNISKIIADGGLPH